jgi:hypothetical protein
MTRLPIPRAQMRGPQGLAPDRSNQFTLPGSRDPVYLGVKAIAKRLFGSCDEKNVKATYYLLETSNIPASKLGSRWKLRESVYQAYMWSQEQRAIPEELKPFVKLCMCLCGIFPLLAELYRGTLDPEQLLQLMHGIDEVNALIEELQIPICG